MGKRWLFAPPRETCEVVIEAPAYVCGKRAVMAYPAMGGGYMSLCAAHGKKHKAYCVSIDAARRGEKPNHPADNRKEQDTNG